MESPISVTPSSRAQKRNRPLSGTRSKKSTVSARRTEEQEGSAVSKSPSVVNISLMFNLEALDRGSTAYRCGIRRRLLHLNVSAEVRVGQLIE
jgi:hypothetical protein